MRISTWRRRYGGRRRHGLIDRPVVSDTTPLIALAGVGLLDLLPRLYGAVSIPEAVMKEYQNGVGPGDPVLTELAWINVVPVTRYPGLPDPASNGEAASITLAVTSKARLILLDDKAARRIADKLGLPTGGTLGLLLTAKRAGLIATVAPVVDEMIAQGRHISGRLRTSVLRTAGELP